jgi:hypothetical protein
VVSRNFSAAAVFGSWLVPYAGVRKSTKTDHRDQTEKPTCSDRIEKIRFFRAILAPGPSQKVTSSGYHSPIHPRWPEICGAGSTACSGCVVTAVLLCGRVVPTTLETGSFPCGAHR